MFWNKKVDMSSFVTKNMHNELHLKVIENEGVSDRVNQKYFKITNRLEQIVASLNESLESLKESNETLYEKFEECKKDNAYLRDIMSMNEFKISNKPKYEVGKKYKFGICKSVGVIKPNRCISILDTFYPTTIVFIYEYTFENKGETIKVR